MDAVSVFVFLVGKNKCCATFGKLDATFPELQIPDSEDAMQMLKFWK